MVSAIVAGSGYANAATLSGPRGIVPARTQASRVFGVPAARARSRRGHPLRAAPASVTVPKLDYHAGSVMHASHVYTIFWEPSSLPSGVEAFSTSPVTYEDAVNNYFTRVAHDSGQSSNVYSAATQYYSGAEDHIAYSSSFIASVVDGTAFPASECEDEQLEEGKSVKLEVCLTARQLAEEIAKVTASQHWTAGPESIFFLYTPKGVGGCFEKGEKSSTGGECAYTFYCAYHYNFTEGSEEVIWANMPYEQTETCTDGAKPEGSDAGPAIDTTSHEHNEAITDPTGEGWWDGNRHEEEEAEHGEPANTDYGQEIGDLCVLSSPFETYGQLLGGSAYSTAGAFNQVIDGHDYLLQQEWSDAAGVSSGGKTPGGCVQLLLPAVIAPAGAVIAKQQTHLDGTASGTAEDPAVTWSWDFGDGSSGEGATPAHTYAEPGDYTVTLSVQDANGNSNTTTRQVHVAPEEHTTSTTTTSSTTTSTVTTSATTSSTSTTILTAMSTTSTAANSKPVTARLSGAELSAMLGLPGNDLSLPGLGAIALGRATCPPACSLSVSLYTTVHTTKRHRRKTRRLLVGTSHIVAASGAAAPIAVKLNAAGKALLRRSHRLVVQLVVRAADPQGAITQLTRTLTLTAPRRGTHRGRR
jgi:PKD domain